MPDPADPVTPDAVPLRLPARMLGRTDRAVSPIWWRLDARPVDASVGRILQRIADSDTAWFVFPADLPLDAIARWQPALRALSPQAHIVLGIDAADLNTRAMKPVYARLDALNGVRCEALLLEYLALAEVKAGRPFHRFARLRDEGRVTYCIAAAEDFASAEWMTEHTPAHGIVAAFGLEDPTLRYRVVDAAGDLGTALIARRPGEPAWTPPRPITPPASVSFALSHPAVAAVMEDLPADEPSLSAILSAAAHPMDEPAVSEWWGTFQQQVPPPPKPRGGHPPEYGA